MTSKYRPLESKEIKQLLDQSCLCDDWKKIRVAPEFSPGKIRHVQFSGRVRLGIFESTITFFGGVTKSAGIYYSSIHNCTIGNNVYINNVKNYIANYNIEDNVVIDNIDILAVDGKSSFGNGTEVAVLNEAGGREVPIFDELSAHLAYILVFYRHRPKVIKKITDMISAYSKKVTSSIGRVCSHARIINSRNIKNVNIGEYTEINGCDRLENGSVNSCREDPVLVGQGVNAKNFIVCSGSKITDGTIILNCFVGQSCTLAKQYSAEKSLFFSNSSGQHGEAWAIFAGPYMVSIHKSTLLISGYFSFLNAGSGSNQSNHTYKLGPVHQGVIERGSKTASDSYILWPARIGPFTLIMGRHYRNSDTSKLPFSYLIEHDDESILVPGVNLRSVGTIRDAQKWPSRDKRKNPNVHDYINFNLLSPHTIQKMIDGVALLKHLKITSGETSEYFTYNSVKMKNASLNNGINFYEIGITKFLGNCLIKRLENTTFKNDKELQKRLKPDTTIGKGDWVDMAGMIAPEKSIEGLLGAIENGTIKTLEKVDKTLKSIHGNYRTYEWAWAINEIQIRLQKNINKITSEDIILLTEDWISSVVKLDNMLLKDTKKEFAINAHIGFGIDGNEQIMEDDFTQVRGTFEDNPLVKEIKDHIIEKTGLGKNLIKRMNIIKK